MSVHYTVRRSPPDEVESDLLRLWQGNLTIACEPAAKFSWTYRAAPNPPPAVFLLTATRANEIPVVGTSGVGVRRFDVGGVSAKAALLGDFAVDVAHRTLMPATVLMRAVRQDSLERYGFAYGSPNARAVPVCRRVGYRELGTMTRHVRVLRHERFLRKTIDLPIVTGGAARLIDAARLALGAPAQLRARVAYRLEWLDRADARFDALWRAARGEYPIIGERSAAFVQWRLLDNPEAGPCRLAALVSGGPPGRIHAYASVEMDGGVARLLDLFGHKAAIAPLLDAILPVLWRRGAETAEMRYLGSDELVGILRSRGFVARESSRVVVYDVGGELAAHDALLRDPRSWHLTDADEDT